MTDKALFVFIDFDGEVPIEALDLIMRCGSTVWGTLQL